MELYAVYVVLTVAQRHDHAVVGQCGNFKARWYGVAVYHPTVVTPHLYAVGQSVEYRVVAELCAFCLHAVVDLF